MIAQGHYANHLHVNYVNYPFGLYCYDALPSAGEPVFKFSDPNVLYTVNGVNIRGSGHVALPANTDVTFQGNSTLKLPTACVLKSECEATEFCVARISGAQGHLADCENGTMPQENTYQNKICCGAEEYCADSVDNTGDGNIDCASPTCHPSEGNSYVPQECTGNNQRSEDCILSISSTGDVTYNESCLNNNNQDAAFYCSYGEYNEFERGFCCPAGEIARLDPHIPGEYFCEEPTQCGVGGLPFYDCDVDHRTNQPNWLTRIFSSTTEEWCVSQLPNFYNPLTELNDRSMGCCFIAQHGHGGFYYHSDNVKIFGYE